MDLSRFDTRDLAHEGVDVPLVIDGETQYGLDNEPVTFRIKGLADPDVHRLILQGTRTGSRTPQEVVDADLKLARTAVVGWSTNWTLEGKAVPFSKDAIGKVFAVPAIRQAVLKCIIDDRLFMKGSSTGPSSTSDN